MRFLHSLTGANRARVIDGLVRIEIMHKRNTLLPACVDIEMQAMDRPAFINPSRVAIGALEPCSIGGRTRSLANPDVRLAPSLTAEPSRPTPGVQPQRRGGGPWQTAWGSSCRNFDIHLFEERMEMVGREPETR